MKKRLFATVLAMALAASLITKYSLGKAADSTAPTAVRMAKTEDGGNSKDTGNSSDAAADRVGTAVDKTSPPGRAGALISIAIPTKGLQRWNQGGANMRAELEAAGYEVGLQYASNDVQTQVSQIENMISNDYQMLVIASIDGSSLGEPLGQTKEARVPVISYGRLIMNSDAVTYYIAFDNYKIEQKQGEYLAEALGLEAATEPEDIKLSAGDPTDSNCNFFFGGTMDVLQKCIDEGKLVVKLGQAAFEQVAIADQDSEEAQNRMDTIIMGNYSDGTVLDAVLCSSDSTTLGVENALTSSYTGTYPVVTDQDRDITNIKNMLSGKQAMSAFKDTRTLVIRVIKMVDAVMQGSEAEINGSSSYDSGTGVIPTYLYEPVVVTANNYKEMLADSDYYTEDQIKQISIQKQIPLPVKRRRKTNFRDG